MSRYVMGYLINQLVEALDGLHFFKQFSKKETLLDIFR